MSSNDYNKKSVYEKDIKDFMRNFDLCEINGIEQSRVLELKEKSKSFKYFIINPKPSDFTGIGKFSNTLRHIMMNPKFYKLESKGEQYLLFMFCTDPNFEALKIFSECNKVSEAKKKCERTFGVFSLELIKIERFFVENLLDQKEKEKIEEEIDRRIYC